ncbi:MAG: ASCH domain-containing protein [Planctomycetota bacterium]|nr:ASCH domain-containing protein [Planctomycetota bacterium]
MMHIAIIRKKYLDRILSGSKCIECRLTKQKRAPFGQIKTGETIFLKQSSGSYRAVAKAGRVEFKSDLTSGRIRDIRREFAEELEGDDDFWESKMDCSYLTLIWLEDVMPTNLGPTIAPLQGRAWVTFQDVEIPINAK